MVLDIFLMKRPWQEFATNKTPINTCMRVLSALNKKLMRMKCKKKQKKRLKSREYFLI